MSEAYSPNYEKTRNQCSSGHDYELFEYLYLDSGTYLNYFRCTRCGKRRFDINGREVSANEYMQAQMDAGII